MSVFALSICTLIDLKSELENVEKILKNGYVNVSQALMRHNCFAKISLLESYFKECRFTFKFDIFSM